MVIWSTKDSVLSIFELALTYKICASCLSSSIVKLCVNLLSPAFTAVLTAISSVLSTTASSWLSISVISWFSKPIASALTKTEISIEFWFCSNLISFACVKILISWLRTCIFVVYGKSDTTFFIPPSNKHAALTWILPLILQFVSNVSKFCTLEIALT